MLKKIKLQFFLFLISAALICCVLTYINKNNIKSPYKDYIVIDVFDSLANYQGIQGGWFTKIVRDKFNMDLNIIAPNVSGGGNTLFETRLLTGDVGDLVIWGGSKKDFYDMVSSDLLLDMTDYFKNKNIMKYQTSIQALNQGFDKEGIYAVPTFMSATLPPDTPLPAIDPIYGPFLRWDLYAELGYPEIKTLEDLLPVLKSMKELMPTSESGRETYAFSFFKDWDVSFMNEGKHIANIYGYDAFGFVLAKGDGSDYQDILDPDSLYMRGMKFYYEANQSGLLDPDSSYQNYHQAYQKYQNGDILYCSLPWIAKPAYNTTEHLNSGNGFMLATIEDMRIFCDGCTPSERIIGIGSKAKDPKRLSDFIDWLFSSEGISLLYTESNVTAGPKGLTWDIGADGPYLTDFGKQVFFSGDAQVPEEWGGGTWYEGIPAINIVPVINKELDDNGYPYAYTLWDTVRNMEVSPIEADWRMHTGSSYPMKYLEDTNRLLVTPSYNMSCPPDSSEISSIRTQCGQYIINYSWKMIFAKNVDEFNQLYEELLDYVDVLGYKKVLNVDLELAKKTAVIRNQNVKAYYNSKRGK